LDDLKNGSLARHDQIFNGSLLFSLHLTLDDFNIGTNEKPYLLSNKLLFGGIPIFWTPFSYLSPNLGDHIPMW
jgi:hypothetical protein